MPEGLIRNTEEEEEEEGIWNVCRNKISVRHQ
jgi:hypothetical protein